MVVLDLSFRPEPAVETEAYVNEVMSFVADLRRSGQSCDPWPAFVAKDGVVMCRISAPAADSLDPRHDSKTVAARRVSMGTLEVRLAGQAAESADLCGCAARPFLVVFTTFLSEETPLRCGGCWGLVPLYAVTAGDANGEYQELVGWAEVYRSLDGLYMASEVGEGFAEAELTQRGSAFGIKTMKVCAEVERRTGLPVYAFLNRRQGWPVDACHECGGRWSREEAAGPWAYRCEPCRNLFPDPLGDETPTP